MTSEPRLSSVASTDLHPDLLAALSSDDSDCDLWECRVCARTARYVLIVPYKGAWGHAVDPRCELHYPEDLPRLSSHDWPGPSTPPRYVRRQRAEKALAEALANAEQAAREVDDLFGGDFGRWTLDGRVVTDDASTALLSLHDYLNDVARERSALQDELTVADA